MSGPLELPTHHAWPADASAVVAAYPEVLDATLGLIAAAPSAAEELHLFADASLRRTALLAFACGLLRLADRQELVFVADGEHLLLRSGARWSTGLRLGEHLVTLFCDERYD
jgi:hypothetical protein